MNSHTTFLNLAQISAPVDSIAQTEQPVSGSAPTQMMGGLGQMLPLILVFAILYFIMIRPAQRKEKDRKKEIDQMRASTKVLFSGGIVGVITEVKDSTFLVKIAEGVVIEIARGAVQRIVTSDNVGTVDDAR